MEAVASRTPDAQTLPSEWGFSWQPNEGQRFAPFVSGSYFQAENWGLSDLEVDYESQEIASIVYSALDVDKELQPDKVKRQMSVSDGKLSVHFEGVEARFLRASFSAFVDVLTLATKTAEEFGKEMEL